jgi:hypothetical protein
LDEPSFLELVMPLRDEYEAGGADGEGGSREDGRSTPALGGNEKEIKIFF